MNTKPRTVHARNVPPWPCVDALLAGGPQRPAPPADGAFELHRIGDAVASRSVHAAIYDALRLCMAL